MNDRPADAAPTESFWIATSSATAYPSLSSNLTVDVAVLGGGIVGVTAATLLSDAGHRVALLEAESISGGVTGHTTAKVTSLHTLVYADLLDAWGEERAREYGEANEAALATIRRLAGEHQIECELEEAVAYTYATTKEDLDRGRREAEVAASLGLPAAWFDDPPLPFETLGAVGFSGQARFHPCKYLLALSARLVGRGAEVFERTRVVEIEEGEPCVVRTADGNVVRAAHVVVATHAPIVDAAVVVARAKAMRGYALALEAGDWVPEGMFISAGLPSRSVRSARAEGRDVLIVSGEGHPVGETDDPADNWRVLEDWAKSELGAGASLNRWSTQDYYSLDRVPFAGRLRPHVTTAAAFGGWGMTNGTAAAMVVTDLVNDDESRWAELYDPWRLKLSSLSELVKKGGHDVGRLVGDRLASEPDETAIDDLPAGGAVVARVAGERVAAHRDTDGRLHAVSAVCTHMGCIVSWNDAERSWDCPCHGSRFDVDGGVLNGPASDRLADRGDALARSEALAS